VDDICIQVLQRKVSRGRPSAIGVVWLLESQDLIVE
jgi:hypothetical protein